VILTFVFPFKNFPIQVTIILILFKK